MNGELAQRIALVAWGNFYIAGHEDEPPDLVHTNSTFQYVGEVAFHRDGASASWSLPRWLRTMREEQRRLRLVDGVFLALGAGGIETWSVAWGPTPEQSARLRRQLQGGRAEWPLQNKRIWAVAYRGHKTRTRAVERGTGEGRGRLRLALEEIHEFSRRMDAGFWTTWFQEALAELDALEPKARFHDDALPAIGYELAARQLFAAGVDAWVFGGMGSWSDLAFPNQEIEYRRVTGNLYRAVMEAFIASVNSWPT